MLRTPFRLCIIPETLLTQLQGFAGCPCYKSGYIRNGENMHIDQAAKEVSAKELKKAFKAQTKGKKPNTESVREFAFYPGVDATAVQTTEAAEKALKKVYGLVVGDHVKLKSADIVGVLIAVSFVPEGTDSHKLTTQVRLEAEIVSAAPTDLKKIAAPKERKTPEQLLKKRHNLVVGDKVIIPTPFAEPATIINVVRAANTLERLTVTVLHTNNSHEEIFEELDGSLVLKKYKETKLRFSDVPVFGAFTIGEKNFVKVGNSTAIAAHVSGTASEPFAMLATENSKLAKTAKRSFKLSDRVKSFAPQ